MFYRVMKGIYQFAANLLSYIPAKYYRNRSTSDLVIAKSRRVNFFLKHSVVNFQPDESIQRYIYSCLDAHALCYTSTGSVAYYCR